jgi:hypothetical protein
LALCQDSAIEPHALVGQIVDRLKKANTPAGPGRQIVSQITCLLLVRYDDKQRALSLLGHGGDDRRYRRAQ